MSLGFAGVLTLVSDALGVLLVEGSKLKDSHLASHPLGSEFLEESAKV